ncbi:MAG: GntR family transcriptional regulator [Stappiaceae bacterium]
MIEVTSRKDDENTLYEAILNDISAGRLEGGQRLKVAELARQYGVSTSPVREVLRRMQGEGFVEISPNKGAAVRKADANTIQNIFEILELLEPYFVAWFAEFSRPEMLREMELTQAEIEKTPVADLLGFRKLDSDFHWAICKRHYNKPAADMWRNMRRALNVYGAKLNINPPRYDTIMHEHRELLAAFADNNVDLSVEVIRRHLKGSFQQMSQQMRVLGFDENR